MLLLLLLLFSFARELVQIMCENDAGGPLQAVRGGTRKPPTALGFIAHFRHGSSEAKDGRPPSRPNFHPHTVTQELGSGVGGPLRYGAVSA